MKDSVRIPADIDREDRILAGLTARQVGILAGTGAVLYTGWLLLHAVLSAVAYVTLAAPLAVGMFVLVVVRRDGLTLDRLLLAGLRQRLQPRARLAPGRAPEPAPSWLAGAHDQQPPALGEVELPVEGLTETGVIDLGDEGLVLIAAASPVNFALRTPEEQQALISAFGRYLHSLNTRAQILIRAQRLDLSAHITDLIERAPGLPHPALEAAALDHAEFLNQLGSQADLLRRQVLLILREPVPTPESRPPRGRGDPSRDGEPSQAARRAVASRLLRRMSEATELLAPAGITLTPLDAAQASAVLATATNPDTTVPPSPEQAGPDEVITTPASTDGEFSGEELR